MHVNAKRKWSPKMIRSASIRTLLAAAAILAAGDAVASQPMHITCTVLLPAAPVPGDEGSYLTILKVNVPAAHDGHRHMHAAAEYLAMVSGTGSITVDGRGDQPLAPGTIVTIPPKVHHKVYNHSGTEPLVFTATIVGHVADPLLTRYVGEPDKLSGCPHTHRAGQN